MFSSTGIRFWSWTIRACSELSSALKARRLAFSPAPGGQAWGPAGAKSSSASANAWRPPSHQNPPQHSSSCKSRKSLGGSAPISNHPASRPQPSWLSIRRENLLRHARHSYARCAAAAVIFGMITVGIALHATTTVTVGRIPRSPAAAGIEISHHYVGNRTFVTARRYDFDRDIAMSSADTGVTWLKIEEI